MTFAFRSQTSRIGTAAASPAALLAGAVLGPALLFGAMAWWSWDQVNRDAAVEISRNADLLEEHTARLFQADALLLARIEDRVAGMDWPQVARREEELHRFLQGASDDIPEIDGAFLADAKGELQAVSSHYPVQKPAAATPLPSNVRDRWYFGEAARRDGLVVDGPFRGRLTGHAIINVARRLPGPDGAFRGVAVLALSPDRMAKFWKSIVSPGDTVSLVREDGRVLMRYPEATLARDGTPAHFTPETMARFRAAAAGQFEGPPSAIDGVVRTVGYRKLPGQTLYIGYAVDRRNVVRAWLHSLAGFGALALAAALALLLSAVAVIRRSRGEAAALARAERAAAALRESEAHFRELYDKTPVPMHSYDERGTLTAVSERWLELLGYAREEVIGRNLVSFQSPSSAASFPELVWRPLMERGELRDVERQYVTRSGEVLDMLISARVERDAQGRFLRALGVLVDVTEQKRMAAALRQAQKMEAVGQMTGGVAHDFNNLLTVVIGNLERIGASAADPHRVGRLAAMALKAAERGAALTHQLLAFSRRQLLRPEVVNPNRFIREFAPLIQQAAGGAVEVQILLSPVVDPCRIDAAQFQAAILNLVVNARDAMAQGGRIAIETRNIEIPARDGAGGSGAEVVPGSYVLVSVADTGAGIPPETLEKVFEPFFTTKEVGRGSGLGLSMVYGFVKQSGGHVEVESEVDVGTTVKLYLPRSAQEPPATGSETGSETPSGTESILLVEDNAEVRDSTVETLRDLGYDVAAVGCAADALDALRTDRRIDLMLSDVVMPGGMTGDALARAAVRLRPGLRVLLTSGYAAQGAGKNVDLDGFPMLAKPYRRAALAARLRELLGDRARPTQRGVDRA